MDLLTKYKIIEKIIQTKDINVLDKVNDLLSEINHSHEIEFLSQTAHGADLNLPDIDNDDVIGALRKKYTM
jgi:hypothetical protein